MWALWGSPWGPRPLPEFLTGQLHDHGYSVDDSGRIARQINESDTSAAVSLFVDLGACKFLEGDIDGAVAAWRHAISSDQDDAASRALLNLGLMYEHLHLHDRALGLLAAAVDRNLDPYVIPAAMASARCQVARGDSEQAMETMARLTQMAMVRYPEGPELAETLFALGDVAERAGRPDRAERSWRVAAAGPASPMQQAAADRRTRLLVDLGHEDELQDAVQDAGGQIGAHALLDSAEALRRFDAGERAQALVEAVDGDALSSNDRFRFAAAKVQCGEVNGAIDEYEFLLGDNEVEVQLRAAYSLGDLYQVYEMGDAAAAMFERVIAADDRYWSPKAALAFGDLLDDQGAHPEATSYWQRAATGEIRFVAEQAQARLSRPNRSRRVAATAEAAEEAPQSPPAQAAAPEAVPAEPQIISLNDMELDDVVEPVPTVPTAEDVSLEDDTTSAEVATDPAAPEPVIVVLSALEDDLEGGDNNIIDLSDAEPDVGAAPPSVFASHLGEVEPMNPYASLAPADATPDASTPTRNPYAELAPNYGNDEFEPPIDVEPGDWESMLDGWPIESPPKQPKKKSSAFSRYT